MFNNDLSGISSMFDFSGIDIEGPTVFSGPTLTEKYVGISTGNYFTIDKSHFRHLTNGFEFIGNNPGVSQIMNSHFDENYIGISINPKTGLSGPANLTLRCNGFKEMSNGQTSFGLVKNSTMSLDIGDAGTNLSTGTKNSWPFEVNGPSLIPAFKSPEGWTSLKNNASSRLKYFTVNQEAVGAEVLNSFAGNVIFSNSSKLLGSISCDAIVPLQFLPRVALTESESLIEENDAELLVFPSPAATTAYLKIKSKGNRNCDDFKILNQVGKEIFEIKFKTATKSNADFEFDISGLPSGIYFIKSKNQINSKSGTKFIVLK